MIDFLFFLHFEASLSSTWLTFCDDISTKSNTAHISEKWKTEFSLNFPVKTQNFSLPAILELQWTYCGSQFLSDRDISLSLARLTFLNFVRIGGNRQSILRRREVNHWECEKGRDFRLCVHSHSGLWYTRFIWSSYVLWVLCIFWLKNHNSYAVL